MTAPSRQLAFRLLERIGANRLHSDDAVNSPEMANLSILDRHMVTEIIYGVLRYRATLDWLLKAHSSCSWQGIATSVKIILRMSLYQLWKMDRVPDHALVNDAVEIAKRTSGPGVARYVNGILRQLTRLRPWEEKDWLATAPEHVGVSLPPWLWTRWRKRFGRKMAREFALSLLTPPLLVFRLHDRMADGLDDRLEHEADDPCLDYGFRKSEIVPGTYIADRKSELTSHVGAYFQSAYFQSAYFQSAYFQDEASQMIPHLAGPLPSGSRVWDACAAPGGKSAILAGMMDESGVLVSSDMNPRRMEHLRGVLRDAAGALVLAADARLAPPFRSGFDLVCADVPCSGIGTLRRNPEIKWRIQPGDLKTLQKTQQQILHGVATAVRPGGRLLYSTCSTEPEENEQVVEDFLKIHADFRLEAPAQPAGMERWIGADLMVRTFPGTRLWDGFFAALLVRSR